MSNLLIVLSIVLILLSLVLLLATPFALIFTALGIALLIRGISGKKKAAYRQCRVEHPADPAPAPVRSVAAVPDGIPSQNPRKCMTVKVAGVTFNCVLDRDENRQNVLDNVYEGDQIEISEYTFKEKPAYLVVDPATGLDIGNLPAPVAETIAGYDDPILEGYVSARGSFEKDDSDEMIEYCEIKLFII